MCTLLPYWATPESRPVAAILSLAASSRRKSQPIPAESPSPVLLSAVRCWKGRTLAQPLPAVPEGRSLRVYLSWERPPRYSGCKHSAYFLSNTEERGLRPATTFGTNVWSECSRGLQKV